MLMLGRLREVMRFGEISLASQVVLNNQLTRRQMDGGIHLELCPPLPPQALL